MIILRWQYKRSRPDFSNASTYTRGKGTIIIIVHSTFTVKTKLIKATTIICNWNYTNNIDASLCHEHQRRNVSCFTRQLITVMSANRSVLVTPKENCTWNLGNFIDVVQLMNAWSFLYDVLPETYYSLQVLMKHFVPGKPWRLRSFGYASAARRMQKRTADTTFSTSVKTTGPKYSQWKISSYKIIICSKRRLDFLRLHSAQFVQFAASVQTLRIQHGSTWIFSSSAVADPLSSYAMNLHGEKGLNTGNRMCCFYVTYLDYRYSAK